MNAALCKIKCEPVRLELKGTGMGDSFRSAGKAIVTFETKEKAATAMQALHFEESLGMNLFIDFYKQHDMRVLQQDKLRNPLQR